MLLSLSDVTLCAVTSINHELTVWAMNQSLRHCRFADVVLISSQPIEAPFRVEVVPHFRGEEYAPFVCRNLAKHTPSAFNLLVQYDSFVVEPRAWTDQFLEYDYIGPKWHWHKEGRRVGNSGFCLRSKKLLDILAEMPLPPTGSFVDDEFICHTMREPFEKNHGIKIAPEVIADRFGYERHIPDQPSFGFHGMFNFWRHVDDVEMEKIPALLDDYYIPMRAFAEILFDYYKLRKFRVFGIWYCRLRDNLGGDKVREHLLGIVNNPPFIDGLIKMGEATRHFYQPENV